jgi:phosphoribosylformylglycinamidine synthase
LKVVHGRKEGRVPALDFAREKALHDSLRARIAAGLVKSAHDCSEGGLAVALAECCIGGGKSVGAEIDLGTTGTRIDQALFGESQSRIVITVAPEQTDAALAQFAARGIPARRLGTVRGPELKISLNGQTLRWPTDALHHAWHGAIARAMA